MLAFLRKYQVFVSSCICLLLSLYILAAAARGQLKTDPIGPLLIWLMRPLQITVQATTGWLKDLHREYLALTELKRENQRLKQRILELETEKNRLLEAEATSRRLRELLDFKAELPAKTITASIVANSASTWFESCLLNKGSRDGVRRGMAVVTPLGVVGRVVAVTSRTAKVLLVTDANSGVDVLIQRTRARGIVSGSLENGPVMKYVKRSEDVQVGDRLVTSGLDGVFPKGLLVGTVIKVRKQNLGLFQSIEILPAVNPANTEEVLVVGSQPAPDEPKGTGS